VILHETLLVPGEVFNIEKLKKTEDRLKNIGFFKNVNVYFVKSEGPMGLGECYRDVHIEVEETSTGNFGAFAGFSTTESIFGGLNITERNFNSEGLFSCWNDGCGVLRGGGEYVYATATIGATSRKYVFSWTKPYFRDTQWAVGFDIERSFNNNVSKDYLFDTIGYLLHATYQINPYVKFGWHYRIKNTIVELDSKAKHNAEIRREADTSGLISGSGITLYYDSTDNPLNPRTGFKSRFDFEYVGLGGVHTYFGLAYINQYFVPIGKDGVIKYRADFRFLNPIYHTTTSTIPIDERLFLGGDSSIRGYRSYRIGPRFPNYDDPSGGISSQLYSVEYAHRYNKRLEPFVFFDAGHLSDDKWEFAVPRAAIGFGARVKVIDSIPPLTIGMGYPLNAHGNQEVKRFFINVGGKF
jgi:outer membrane protein insertion porin family